MHAIIPVFAPVTETDNIPIKLFPWQMKMNIPPLLPFTCSCAHIQIAEMQISLYRQISFFFSCSSTKLQSCCSDSIPSSQLFSNLCIIVFFKPFFFCCYAWVVSLRQCSRRPHRRDFACGCTAGTAGIEPFWKSSAMENWEKETYEWPTGLSKSACDDWEGNVSRGTRLCARHCLWRCEWQ